MTPERAGGILGCSPSQVRKYFNERLLRGKYLDNGRGHRVVVVDGRDVQSMHRLRERYGVVEGNRRWRELRA